MPHSEGGRWVFTGVINRLSTRSKKLLTETGSFQQVDTFYPCTKKPAPADPPKKSVAGPELKKMEKISRYTTGFHAGKQHHFIYPLQLIRFYDSFQNKNPYLLA